MCRTTYLCRIKHRPIGHIKYRPIGVIQFRCYCLFFNRPLHSSMYVSSKFSIAGDLYRTVLCWTPQLKVVPPECLNLLDKVSQSRFFKCLNINLFSYRLIERSKRKFYSDLCKKNIYIYLVIL